MLIDPTDWFQNEEIQLDRVETLNEDAMIAAIRQQVEASPQRSILLNINGFRERFPSALRKTAFLAHVLDIDTPLVVFDWQATRGRRRAATSGHRMLPDSQASTSPG